MQAPYPPAYAQGLANDSFKHFCTRLGINLWGHLARVFHMSENYRTIHAPFQNWDINYYL